MDGQTNRVCLQYPIDYYGGPISYYVAKVRYFEMGSSSAPRWTAYLQ